MNKQEAIEHVLQYFNYQNAWEMMQGSSYWIHSPSESNTPERLEEWLGQFVRQTCTEMEGVKAKVSIGGFEVEAEVADCGGFYLRVMFVGEEFDNYD